MAREATFMRNGQASQKILVRGITIDIFRYLESYQEGRGNVSSRFKRSGSEAVRKKIKMRWIKLVIQKKTQLDSMSYSSKQWAFLPWRCWKRIWMNICQKCSSGFYAIMGLDYMISKISSNSMILWHSLFLGIVNN